MGLDIDALVSPLSEEEPSGPDLYGDFDRQEIEQAFERSVSEGEPGSGEEVDWPEICRKILAQAATTRDLWLPVYLMRAGAHAGDLEQIADGAELLARLVEDRWEDVHPQLDEVGFIGRKAPCESLARNAEFLIPLQKVTLLSHPRMGKFNGADFLRFMEEGSGADNYGMFRGVLEATPVEDVRQVAERIDALTESLRRADKALTGHAEGDTSTNFDPTYDMLRRLRLSVAAVLPADEQDSAQQDESDDGNGPLAARGSADGPSFSGAIRNRDDVRRAIDSICEYYNRYEPASPVPFALRRAKEWISLDFLAVLEDIAPNSLDEAGQLLKSKISNSGAAPEADNSW